VVRVIILATALAVQAGDAPVGSAAFDKEIRPLLQEYCLKCHSTEKQKGELDLEQFSSLDAVRRQPKIWQSVAEQLANKEMPPKDKPQPPAPDRARLAGWVDAVLDEIALAHAGDPGPVVLRRLSNAEYTYTLRDLTGVESLDPAREFPVDGAAGEGFTNTGNALVMSPSLLTKYFDAGKELANHMVLLPDGIRFSPSTTRRDWTEEVLVQIREFYRAFTDSVKGEKVKVDGAGMVNSDGGTIAFAKYFAATLAGRDTLRNGGKSVETVAREHGLNARYLGLLFATLDSKEPSLLLDGIRARWREAKPEAAAALAAEVGQWQKSVWKFGSVGHIGKVGGPKAWMEPVNPLAAKQDVRLKLPDSPDGKEVILYLAATDAGDGNENDFAVWQQPRIVAPGRPDLLLRDVRAVSAELADRRARIFAVTAKSLTAAAEASAASGAVDVPELARKYGVDVDALAAWLGYLGIGSHGPARIDSYFTTKIGNGSYDFIKGWGSDATPSLAANSSDQHVRVPGNMKPHSVAVHPSPTLQAAIGWRSPAAMTMQIEAVVTHAHPECGNGVTWSLELRRGATRQRLAAGIAQGGTPVKVPPVENLAVQPGDLVSVLIGPRNSDHSCDLTAVDLALTSSGENPRTWSLAEDVSPDVQAGNPHADRFGNLGVWHFYTEPDKGGSDGGPMIEAGSLLAKWQSAPNAAEKQKLAEAIQTLLTSAAPADKASPDGKLYRQLTSFGGPLFSAGKAPVGNPPSSVGNSPWGLDPATFGRHPNGQPIDPASLCVRAPAVIEVHLPADLVSGCEFVATGALDAATGAEGSVQMQVLTAKPEGLGLQASTVKQSVTPGSWNEQLMSIGTPIITADGSAARKRIEAAFDAYRQIFPAALCYSKIVPVDEVVTLTLFHREDDQLARLMLDDAQRAHLDRLWDELHYIAQDAITLVDAFEQIWQYSTQDGPNAPQGDKRLEPLREPINRHAAELKQRLVDTQPQHLEGVLGFANLAYRRPLTDAETAELRGLYRKLRAEELPHEDAIRLTLARVLVAPAFLYRLEKAAPGLEPGPISDSELASRLSYFLWSSAPDAELRAIAAAGRLHEPEVLLAQTHRMLRDARTRRLATEFACQWVHIRDFDHLDEKSDRFFPTFTTLRGAMYEESIRFFTDLFARDGTVLDILDADYTFLNESLAKHYGVPGIAGEEWQRVDGMKKFGRGGILGQATTLAKNSGASRTSPILRGNWVAEALLGDKLPKPPKDVPRLPEEEGADTLTVRQLTEKHTTDPRCAGCHVRIDPFGYALEGFDAIGRKREKDLADRPIDVKATLANGTPLDGLDGLRTYLLTTRRREFVDQFCKKLLGYSLGRGVQLSDRPLLAEMRRQLETHDYRVSAAIDTIVSSRPFLQIRGIQAIAEQ
jgi:hypothetical protein